MTKSVQEGRSGRALPADIVEVVPRAFENIGPVATAQQREPYATVLRETTRIMMK
jgi:hypothetical protein